MNYVYSYYVSTNAYQAETFVVSAESNISKSNKVIWSKFIRVVMSEYADVEWTFWPPNVCCSTVGLCLSVL